jgi:hypothetical protein
MKERDAQAFIRLWNSHKPWKSQKIECITHKEIFSDPITIGEKTLIHFLTSLSQAYQESISSLALLPIYGFVTKREVNLHKKQTAIIVPKHMRIDSSRYSDQAECTLYPHTSFIHFVRLNDPRTYKVHETVLRGNYRGIVFRMIDYGASELREIVNESQNIRPTQHFGFVSSKSTLTCWLPRAESVTIANILLRVLDLIASKNNKSITLK